MASKRILIKHLEQTKIYRVFEKFDLSEKRLLAKKSKYGNQEERKVTETNIKPVSDVGHTNELHTFVRKENRRLTKTALQLLC